MIFQEFFFYVQNNYDSFFKCLFFSSNVQDSLSKLDRMLTSKIIIKKPFEIDKIHY
jgi:hypothetical protein